MISHMDHMVIITENEAKCIHFYVDILGMELETYIEPMPTIHRKALRFGDQKLNIKVKGHWYMPKPHVDFPGTLDLCFIVSRPLDEVIEHLGRHNIRIEEGPVERIGAKGRIRSIFIRDPDRNIIELSEYIEKDF